MSNSNQSNKNSSNSENGGFFSSLFSGLFKSTNPEAEKRRKLKAVLKSFSKTKYRSFYKPSTYEVQPTFAKLFYDIYKIVYPAQNALKSTTNAGLIKHQIISFCLSEKQVNLLESFSEEGITALTKQMDLDSVVGKVEANLTIFQDEFTSERITRIENLYKSYNLLKDFCTYDYYMLLKRFTSALVEGNFDAVPEFRKTNAEYVVDDMKDFITVSYAITDESIVWSDLFEFLKQTRGNELIPQGTWKKIIAKIRSIQLSRAFELMIKHMTSSPDFTPEIKESNEILFA